MSRPPRSPIADDVHWVLDVVEADLRVTRERTCRAVRDLSADLAALRHMNRIEVTA